MPERMNPDGSHSGHCDATAHVHPSAQVDGLARVLRQATVTGTVADEAIVTGHAQVHGLVSGQSTIDGHAVVYGTVSDRAVVRGYAKVMPGAMVSANATVEGDVVIPAGAEIGPDAWITSRLGYAGGQIGGETWDAYTVWIKDEWRVALRFACATKLITCWDQEQNVQEHAYNISNRHSPYWIDAIESVRDLVKCSVVLPSRPPVLMDAPVLEGS